MVVDREELDFDLAIDPNYLDRACLEQGELFYKWAERAVHAREEMERLKSKMETTSAKLQMQVRKAPADFDLKRATESAISARVDCDKRILNLRDLYLRARSQSALLERAVDAMEMRKRMLEVMITLHGQQYFAGPSVPHDLAADWKEHRQQREAIANDRVKSKARKRVGKPK
jgi:hypothetical protein